MAWSDAARAAALEARRMHMVHKRIHELPSFKVSATQAAQLHKFDYYGTKTRVAKGAVVGRPTHLIRLAGKLLQTHTSPLYGSSPKERSMIKLAEKILNRKGR